MKSFFLIILFITMSCATAEHRRNPQQLSSAKSQIVSKVAQKGVVFLVKGVKEGLRVWKVKCRGEVDTLSKEDKKLWQEGLEAALEKFGCDQAEEWVVKTSKKSWSRFFGRKNGTTASNLDDDIGELILEKDPEKKEGIVQRFLSRFKLIFTKEDQEEIENISWPSEGSTVVREIPSLEDNPSLNVDLSVGDCDVVGGKYDDYNKYCYVKFGDLVSSQKVFDFLNFYTPSLLDLPYIATLCHSNLRYEDDSDQGLVKAVFEMFEVIESGELASIGCRLANNITIVKKKEMDYDNICLRYFKIPKDMVESEDSYSICYFEKNDMRWPPQFSYTAPRDQFPYLMPFEQVAEDSSLTNVQRWTIAESMMIAICKEQNYSKVSMVEADSPGNIALSCEN